MKKKFLASLCVIFFTLYYFDLMHYIDDLLSGYDVIYEYQFTKVLDERFDAKSIEPVYFQGFTSKEIAKVCMQGPYSTQDWFESKVGEKVNDFHITNDDFDYVLWFFNKDGSLKRAHLRIYAKRSHGVCAKGNSALKPEYEENRYKFQLTGD